MILDIISKLKNKILTLLHLDVEKTVNFDYKNHTDEDFLIINKKIQEIENRLFDIRNRTLTDIKENKVNFSFKYKVKKKIKIKIFRASSFSRITSMAQLAEERKLLIK